MKQAWQDRGAITIYSKKSSEAIQISEYTHAAHVQIGRSGTVVSALSLRHLSLCTASYLYRCDACVYIFLSRIFFCYCANFAVGGAIDAAATILQLLCLYSLHETNKHRE